MPSSTTSSEAARGKAASARELGYQNKVDGFQKGGEHRQAANKIVHAPAGTAGQHKAAAKELKKKAVVK
jgi:hypothetical protein